MISVAPVSIDFFFFLQPVGYEWLLIRLIVLATMIGGQFNIGHKP